MSKKSLLQEVPVHFQISIQLFKTKISTNYFQIEYKKDLDKVCCILSKNVRFTFAETKWILLHCLRFCVSGDNTLDPQYITIFEISKVGACTALS